VDTCQAGVCVGADPVACTALDQCHVVGQCDPVTGACSDPVKADGTACDDGDECTQVDTCQAGVCVGADPVVCTALDQCHAVGQCDAATGACSDPVKADGTACDDGTLCTRSDTCVTGSCVGTLEVLCSAVGQCHDAGACDPATGLCSHPQKAVGTGCDDGDDCTVGDECDAGLCISGEAISACANGDFCCPDGCGAHNDNDCFIPVPTMSGLAWVVLTGLLALAVARGIRRHGALHARVHTHARPSCERTPRNPVSSPASPRRSDRR
jgi:hypothetical protein